MSSGPRLEADQQGAGDTSGLGRRMSLIDRMAYRVCWSALWLLCKAWFRFRVVGKANLPRDGAYILSPVHRSYLDTPVGGMVTARRQRFLGKESLWRNRLSGRFLTIVGGFPVERGTADRAALRACQEVLERGEPMVMFPEGTRQYGPTVRAELLHAGPAFVAARAGVPIVPMGIAGTDYAMPGGSPMIRPSKVILVVGEPIQPPIVEGRVPRRVVDELTERLRVGLQAVFDEAQRLRGRPALPEPEVVEAEGPGAERPDD
ncbi:MAG: lysophospholipid acyltransferase family protein [Actinomycetota bacterium]|nr:lysophospholipid acyltransferase family protein [Actinomycetota bacterium]MEE2958003.1 lysophospholipid acyltransferase family protein [Actinomycetota bacterium]